MIDIRIDGFPADLEPGTTLLLNKPNPVFSFGQIPGPYVLDFSLPITPRNRRILGYVEHPQAGINSRRYYCEKYVESTIRERGYIKVKNVSKDRYNLYFTQDLGRMFGDYQTTRLSEIDFGTIPVPASTTIANALTDPFCWPMIENTGLYGNTVVPDWNGFINGYNSGTGNFDTPGRIPQLFLRWVMNQYAALTGWSFTGDFWTNPDLQRLILYNLYTLDGRSTIRYQNHLPDLTMPGLLVGLRDLFNLFIEFDVNRKVVDMSFANSIMATAPVVDWSNKVSADQVKQPDVLNRLGLSFNIDTNDAMMKPVPVQLDKYTTAETPENAGGSLFAVQSSFSTLDHNTATGRARTSQPGISSYNKDSSNNAIAPKLLFWNGVVGSEPRATLSQGNFSLAWHGPNNLVSTCWSEFERFKGTTFSITKDVQLTPADLAKFSFKNRVHIKGVDYWVSNLKVVLQPKARVYTGQVELWKA